MPTYAYRCDACGHQFEAFQKFADEPLRECPACGAAVRRVIHPVGVVFKGSGWYITDSRPKPAEDGGGDKTDKTEKTDKKGGAAKKDKVAAEATTKTAKASEAVAAD
jgi:putative FmdB family regulatory protein